MLQLASIIAGRKRSRRTIQPRDSKELELDVQDAMYSSSQQINGQQKPGANHAALVYKLFLSHQLSDHRLSHLSTQKTTDPAPSTQWSVHLWCATDAIKQRRMSKEAL